MLVSVPNTCIVDLVVTTSLSGLHSIVERVRFQAMIGGRMNYWLCDKGTNKIYAYWNLCGVILRRVGCGYGVC